MADKIEGEGSYKASRDYKQRIDGFMTKNKGDIPARAKAAKDALGGAEKQELLNAEAKAAARARAQDEQAR